MPPTLDWTGAIFVMPLTPVQGRAELSLLKHLDVCATCMVVVADPTSFGFHGRYIACRVAMANPVDATVGGSFGFLKRYSACRMVMADPVDATVGVYFGFLVRYPACRVVVTDPMDIKASLLLDFLVGI